MTGKRSVDGAKNDKGHSDAIKSASARRLSASAASPGEMALQGSFGHPATQSTQQGLVRLVGHRNPTRRTASQGERGLLVAGRLIITAE